jgi:hypothetical protein
MYLDAIHQLLVYADDFNLLGEKVKARQRNY